MKDPNRTGTMSAERFIAKLRKRDATRARRRDHFVRLATARAEGRFDGRESAWRCDQLSEVIESERGPAVTMAQALGLEIDAQPEQAAPGDRTAAEAEATFDKTFGSIPELLEDASDEPTPEPAVDDVPDRLREPLSPERLAVARGGKR